MEKLIECVNCKEKHKESFIEVDMLGDHWCIDCLSEELELDYKELVK